MIALLLAVTLELGPMEPAAKVLVVPAKVTNSTDRELRDVTVFAELKPGPVLARQSDDAWTCRDHGTLKTVRCTAAVLPAKTTVPLTFYIDARIGRFRVEVRVGDGSTAAAEGWFPRDVHVTHGGDAGEGSLRHAIRVANEDREGWKVPCRIVSDREMTIRPRTPLPELWGDDIALDGAGRVTLDGSHVSGGSGLEIVGSTGRRTAVRGLTIRAFPRDGIHIDRTNFDPVIVDDCVIGTNGSRGIATEAQPGLTVRRIRIRWSGRSGVFALGPNATIEENSIDENGASGVFVDRYRARIARNRIAGNTQVGVAASRHIGTLEIAENSISGNGVSGIDRGLNGFDGYVLDDHAGVDAVIPPPRITEARFDGATTTVRGTYSDRDRWGTRSLELFATRDGQGETFLGHAVPETGAFTVVVPRDLRGQSLTAARFRHLNLGWSGEWRWTSEFAEPKEVDVRVAAGGGGPEDHRSRPTSAFSNVGTP